MGDVCDQAGGAYEKSCRIDLSDEFVCTDCFYGEVNKNCVGAFSTCSAQCMSTYSISAPQSGSGTDCANNHGDTQACNPGDGACPCKERKKIICLVLQPSITFSTILSGCFWGALVNIRYLSSFSFSRIGAVLFYFCNIYFVVNTNCIGAFSTCAADCGVSTFSISTPQSGQGANCANNHGDTQACNPGDGDCPGKERKKS